MEAQEIVNQLNFEYSDKSWIIKNDKICRIMGNHSTNFIHGWDKEKALEHLECRQNMFKKKGK